MSDGPRRVTRRRSPVALLVAGLAVLGLALLSGLSLVGDRPTDDRSGEVNGAEDEEDEEEPGSADWPEDCGYEDAAGGGGYTGGAIRCGPGVGLDPPPSELRPLR